MDVVKQQSDSGHVLWWARCSAHKAYLQTAPSLKLCGLLLDVVAQPERIEGWGLQVVKPNLKVYMVSSWFKQV